MRCSWDLFIRSTVVKGFNCACTIVSFLFASLRCDSSVFSSGSSVSVITLICTRHAYLASGHIRFLLCQNTTKQLFLKTPFINAHVPYSITACMYMLADPKQPTCTYKRMKKGKLMTEHTTLGELTKPFGHAWLRVQPNT
jgi:hypothetical protein